MQKALNYFIIELNSLFYYAFSNAIIKITPLNFQKTSTSYEKDHPTPKTNVKEKIRKGQYNNYTIKMNSKLCLRTQ